MTVVDALNIYTFTWLLVNRCSNVHVLFQSGNRAEFVYGYILLKLGCEIAYKESDFISHINYFSSYDEMRHVIKNEYIESGRFVDRLIAYHLWPEMYPFLTVLEYAKKSYSGNIDLLISGFDYVELIGVDARICVHGYFWPMWIRKNYYKEFGLYFNKAKVIILSFAYLVRLFFVRIGSKKRKPFDLLAIVGQEDRECMKNTWLVGRVYNKLCYHAKNRMVSSEGEESRLFYCSLATYFEYLFYLYRVYKLEVLGNNLSFYVFVKVMSDYKYYFFFKKLVDDAGVKVIFTCYEGASLAMVSNYVGYHSDRAVSVNATWSLPYFSHYMSFMKHSDVFFSWGEYHRDLSARSFNQCRYYVDTGYYGDYAFSQCYLNVLRNLGESNSGYCVISVYDNIAGHGHFHSIESLEDFYSGVVSLLKDERYFILVKSKRDDFKKTIRDKRIIRELMLHENRIVFFDEHGDMGPAIESDIVFAYSLSTLGCIAALWGKKVFLHDANGIIDKKDIPMNAEVVRSSEEFGIKVRKHGCYTDLDVEKSSRIDPFVDGHAQDRISQYIDWLLAEDGDKQTRLNVANRKYIDRFGKHVYPG